jgi:hypothetical protein
LPIAAEAVLIAGQALFATEKELELIDMLPEYYLKKTRIVVAVATSHLSQAGFAEELGLCRSHWSQVLNGHRAATPRIRRALLAHPVLEGVPERELWDIVPAESRAA